MGKVLLIELVLFIIVAFVVSLKYSVKAYLWCYLSAFVLFLPVATYISQFWDHPFSEDPNSWGVFGDFIGGTYNILVSLLLAYISYRVSKMQTSAEKIMSIANDLYNQIKSLPGKNYHHKSIEKVQRTLKDNDLFIDGLLKECILALLDDYTTHRAESTPINYGLENAVLNQLMKLANGK